MQNAAELPFGFDIEGDEDKLPGTEVMTCQRSTLWNGITILIGEGDGGGRGGGFICCCIICDLRSSYISIQQNWKILEVRAIFSGSVSVRCRTIVVRTRFKVTKMSLLDSSSREVQENWLASPSSGSFSPSSSFLPVPVSSCYPAMSAVRNTSPGSIVGDYDACRWFLPG